MWYMVKDKDTKELVTTIQNGQVCNLMLPDFETAAKFAQHHYGCDAAELGAKCTIDGYVIISNSKISGSVTRAQYNDGLDMLQFFDEQAKWSREVFGEDILRGPVGPLKHLAKEAQEALEAKTPEHRSEEIVDCLFVVFDAARRHGFTYRSLAEAAMRKLEINKKRNWPTPTTDEPVEHIREPKSE